jgi:hypothetical protein
MLSWEAMLVPRRALLLALPSCALASWDGFAGGRAGDASPQDAGEPDAIVEAGTDARAAAPIELVAADSTVTDKRVASVTVTNAKVHRAGDLLVVAIGWFDTDAALTEVRDTKGNRFQRAVGPTIFDGPPLVAQAIYYAPNIAAAEANANTLTVTWTAAADSPDVRMLEYSGLDPISPLDATAASSGKSTAASSGTATTKFARELLFGAASTQGEFGMSGPGFTLRVITSHNNMTEDRIVDGVGTYSADAPLPAPAEWVMQMVTFH